MMGNNRRDSDLRGLWPVLSDADPFFTTVSPTTSSALRLSLRLCGLQDY
jgi:hypothetical protein